MRHDSTRLRSTEAVASLRILLILVIILPCGSCASPRQPIRIGVNPWPPCELWYVAEAQGMFGNLDVDIVRFSTWTDNMKALPLGNIDITHSSYFNALVYHSKGAGGKIVLKSDTIVGGDGLAARPGLELADLRGKKIAVELETDEHFLLYKALASVGIPESAVFIVPSASIDAARMLGRGEVDACFTYEPYLSEAADASGGRILFSTRDVPDTMIDVLVASGSLVEKRSDDVKALLEAYVSARRWVEDHPAEAFRLMAGKEKMPPADFELFFRSFTFFEPEDAKLSDVGFLARLDEMNEFLAAHGFIPAEQAARDAVWLDEATY
ncbi:MAG: ABC transporter substrate-binding protein [Spirochaetaceae bacterium]|nr:ABC transporter substrate-binding protein [Spirochaetaceae bacterium]